MAKKLRVSPQMVGRWRARFVTRRVDGLLDEPRPGAPRTITDDTVEAVRPPHRASSGGLVGSGDARHGTQHVVQPDPVAGLDAQSGQVIGRTYRRHRAIEFRTRSNRGGRAARPRRPPDPRQLQHPQNAADPGAPSPLALVERWFAELTTKQLRRGTHRSVRRLEAAIWEFLDTSNAAGKPFVWTKSADEILASIARFAQRTLVVHN